MSIPNKKREALNEMGIDDEILDDVEQSNKSLSSIIKAHGIPTKEISEEEVPAETPVEETSDEPAPEGDSVEETPVEDAPAEEVSEEISEEDVPAEDEPALEDEPVDDAPAEELDGEDIPAAEGFTEEQTKELAEAFGAFGKQLSEGILAEVKKIVEPVQKDLKEQAEAIVRESPKASLVDLIINSPGLRKESATLSKDNIVDGRTSLASDKPLEAEESNEPIVFSGNALIDGVITDIIQTPEQLVQ